jgi:hypothetical protein
VKKLIVEVDASSIKGMLDNPDIQASAVINRWIQGIQQFDFKLVHVPAHKHRGPDALSRRPFCEQDFSGESDPEEWVDNIALLTRHQPPSAKSPLTPTQYLNPPVPLNDITFMDFLNPQLCYAEKSMSRTKPPHDPELELDNILTYLVTRKEPQLGSKQEVERFKKIAQQFYLWGIHLYRRRNESPPQVVIFNKKRRQAILWEMHEDNAHHGVWAVAKQTTLRYYWPNILEDIKHHIQSCHTCQLRSTKKNAPSNHRIQTTVFIQQSILGRHEDAQGPRQGMASSL